jgi:hypothetical protein
MSANHSDAEVGTHPLEALWQRGDLGSWAASLAPNVILYSEIFRRPFFGRKAVVEVYRAGLGLLGDFVVTDRFADGRAQLLFWNGEIAGRRIEGVDLLRLNEHGATSEIRVLVRPLRDVALFAAAAGPVLAARRSRFRGLVAQSLVAPLRLLVTAADVIGSRLTQRR